MRLPQLLQEMGATAVVGTSCPNTSGMPRFGLACQQRCMSVHRLISITRMCVWWLAATFFVCACCCCYPAAQGPWGNVQP